MIIKVSELLGKTEGYWYRDAHGSRIRLDNAYASYGDYKVIYVEAGRFQAVFGADEEIEVELA